MYIAKHTGVGNETWKKSVKKRKLKKKRIQLVYAGFEIERQVYIEVLRESGKMSFLENGRGS